MSSFLEVARLFVDPAIVGNHGVAGNDHRVRALGGNFPGFRFRELASELGGIRVANGFFIGAAGTGFIARPRRSRARLRKGDSEARTSLMAGRSGKDPSG